MAIHGLGPRVALDSGRLEPRGFSLGCLRSRAYEASAQCF